MSPERRTSGGGEGTPGRRQSSPRGKDGVPAAGWGAPAEPRDDRLHRLFRIGTWLKGLDGLLELAGGTALLVLSRGQILRAAVFVTRRELSEDPGDPVANAILAAARHLAVDVRHFAAAYLLVHGAVKLVLVAGLLAERRRAFPVALAVLGAFVAYQVYRTFASGSLVLAGLTLVDIGIIALVAREWRVLERRTS
ncbi:MAG TPA: DUF2127 domain-containing protein [Gemmatimonadota bacterium]|nr:DUF2127 domain-containing protein [Gemmatimonadota bacterium]